jgi:hypothetical protein
MKDIAPERPEYPRPNAPSDEWIAWYRWKIDEMDRYQTAMEHQDAKTIVGLRAEIERLRALAPDNMPKDEREWWIALKAQIAELVELRAEVERLRTQCGGNCRYWEGRWRDEKADNARLRAVLELIAGTATDKLQAIQARSALTNIGADPARALEPKP